MKPDQPYPLNSHPSKTKLDVMKHKALKDLWANFEKARLKAPPVLVNEFITREQAEKVIIESLGNELIVHASRKMNTSQFQNMVTTFHTLATWRISQGIYSFDPDVYSSLVESLIGSEIPGDVLVRLPERCIFVETPSLEFQLSDGTKSPIQGIWARLEALTGIDEIVLVIQPLLTQAEPDAFLHAFRIPLQGDIDRWNELIIENTAEIRALDGLIVDKDKIRHGIEVSRAWLMPVLNLLLYLCSRNAEIGNGKQRPQDPQLKRTKRGQRFFPPPLPSKWEVAVRLGAALRQAWQKAADTTDASFTQKRPHIRRAHWHGYRVGPMTHPDGAPIPSTERRFELQWLPPIAVKVDGFEDLPGTIRPVD